MQRLSIGAAFLIAMLLSQFTIALAQEPSSESASAAAPQPIVIEEKPLTRAQMRKQLEADQRMYIMMEQRATGEYRARPTSRFPTYHTYYPTMVRLNAFSPYGPYAWYHHGWY